MQVSNSPVRLTRWDFSKITVLSKTSVFSLMKSSRSWWPPLSAVPLPEGDVSHGITCKQGLWKGWQKGVSQWWGFGFCCCKLRQIMVVKMLLSHWLWRQQKNDEGVRFARGKIFSGFEMQLRKGLMVKRHFLHVEEKENPKRMKIPSTLTGPAKARELPSCCCFLAILWTWGKRSPPWFSSQRLGFWCTNVGS